MIMNMAKMTGKVCLHNNITPSVEIKKLLLLHGILGLLYHVYGEGNIILYLRRILLQSPYIILSGIIFLSLKRFFTQDSIAVIIQYLTQNFNCIRHTLF